MPRYVDHDAREQEIREAVIAVLAEGGFERLTLRSLAERLGGSITLITHYFPTKDAAVAAALRHTLIEAHGVIDELGAIENPDQRLIEVLRYFLPIDEEGLRLERARVAMVVQKDVDPVIHQFFVDLEPAMRDVVRAGISAFYPPDEVEGMIDLFRAWTSGIALSAVEHPEIWTAEKQLEVLDRFLSYVTVDRKAAGR